MAHRAHVDSESVGGFRAVYLILLPWVVGLLILLPLVFADIPPLGDYPNHLARIEILSALPDDPIFARFFQAIWKPYPNLALDLIVWPLSGLLGFHAAGKLFTGFVLVANVWGACCYHRSQFGRVSAWPLVVGFWAYNQYVLSGFLNFALGIGLAIGFAGLTERLFQKGLHIRIGWMSLFATSLYLVHLASLPLYVLLLGARALHQAVWQRREPAALASLARQGLVVAIACLPAILLFLFGDLGDDSQNATAPDNPEPVEAGRGPWQLLLDFPRMALAGHMTWLNAAFALVLAVTVITAARRGYLRVAIPPVVVVCVLLVGFTGALAVQSVSHIVTPHLRFVGPIVLISLLCVDICPVGRYLVGGTAIGLLFLIAQTGRLAWEFRAYDAETSEIRTAFSLVPAGSKVLSLKPDVTPGVISRQAPSWHFYYSGLLVLHQYQTLIAAENRLFMPYFFAHPSKQVLRIRDEYKDMAYNDGGVPTPWSAAMDVRNNPSGDQSWLKTPIWWPTRDWPARFEYISVLYPDLIPDLQVDDPMLKSVYRGRWFAVYRIQHEISGRVTTGVAERLVCYPGWDSEVAYQTRTQGVL